MPDGGSIRLPDVVVPVTLSGEEKVNAFIKTLERLARGDELNRYWKSQKALIDDLTQACESFNRANTDTNAKNLINTSNALKALSGADLSPLFKNIDAVNDAISRANIQVGNFAGKILPQEFQEAFDSFKLMEAAGLDMEDTFRRFTSSTDVEQLQRAVNELSIQLRWAKRNAEEARAELESLQSGEGIKQLKDDLEAVQDRLSNVTERMKEEFRAFLSANDISENDEWGWGRFDAYFEQIESGSLTAKEAIAKFRVEYSELFSDGSGEARIPSEQLNHFVELLERACNEVETLSNYIRALDASSLQNIAHAMSESANLTDRQRDAMGQLAQDANGLDSIGRILAELVRSSGAAEEGAEAVRNSLGQILNTLRELSSVDVESLTALGTMFRSLGLLNEITIDHTQLANLATALRAISEIANLGNTVTLSAIDLSGFNNLHVSKSSLGNLSAFLPDLAKLNMANLERLSKVNLTNFNDIKVSKSSIENLLKLANVMETLQLIQNKLNIKVPGGPGGGGPGGGGPGGGGPGGGGSGGGPGGPSLAGDNELAAANRRLIELRENSAAWAGSFTDAARSAVTDLNGVIERLATLRDEVADGKLPLEEFQERFAKISAEATSAAEVVKRFGNDSQSATSASPSLSAIEMQLESINRLKSAMGSGIFSAWKATNNGGTDEERKSVEELTEQYKILGETVKDANRNKSQISPAQLKTVQEECEALYREIELLRNTQEERRKAADEARRTSGKAPQDNEYAAQAKLMAEAQRQLDAAFRAATSGKGAFGDKEKIEKWRQDYDALVRKQQEFKDATHEAREELIQETRTLTDNIREGSSKKNVTKDETDALAEKNRMLQLVTRLERDASDELRRSKAAKYGKSSNEYRELERVAKDAATLRDEVKKADGAVANFDTRYKSLNNTLKTSVNVIATNGERAKTLAERIGGLADKFAVWFSITRIIMAVVRAIRQMISNAVELDDALTQLEVVTHANASEMRAYGKSITETAKEISASVKDLIDSTTVYARLGYTLDESSKLAKYTSMLQNVGDIDAEAAQNAITAIVKAYGVGVDQIEQIMDKMVKVGKIIAQRRSNVSQEVSYIGQRRVGFVSETEERLDI